MPNCPACGASYQPEQLFCSECGARLPKGNAQENAPAPVFEPDVIVPANEPEKTVDSPITPPSAPVEEPKKYSAEPFAPYTSVQRPQYAPSGGTQSSEPEQPTQPTQQTYAQPPVYTQPTAQQSPSAPNPSPAYIPAQQSSKQNTAAPEKGSLYAPVSTGTFYGAMLLFAVPIVGLVFAIVWACGGCKRKNLRSFALAHILYSLTATLLAVLASVLIWTTCRSVIVNTLEEYGLVLVDGNGEVITAETDPFAPASESVQLSGNAMERLKKIMAGDYVIRYSLDMMGFTFTGVEASRGEDRYTEMSIAGWYSSYGVKTGGVVYKYDEDRGVYCVSDYDLDMVFDLSNMEATVLDTGAEEFNGRTLSYETYESYDTEMKVFVEANGQPCGVRFEEDGEQIDIILTEISTSPSASLFVLPDNLQEISETEFDEGAWDF